MRRSSLKEVPKTTTKKRKTRKRRKAKKDKR